MDELAAATSARLRHHLAASSYDWVVLTDPANVAYATGYRSVAGDIFKGHRMAAVVGTEDLFLVVPASDGAAVGETAVVPDRVVPYGRFFFESRDGSHPDMADVQLPVGMGIHRKTSREAAYGPQRHLTLKSRIFTLLRDELGLGRQPGSRVPGARSFLLRLGVFTSIDPCRSRIDGGVLHSNSLEAAHLFDLTADGFGRGRIR